MKYFLVESAISEFDFRPDEDFVNAVTYRHVCRECGNRFTSSCALDIKIVAEYLPLILGGFGHPNINFARRDFLQAVSPPEGLHFLLGSVFNCTGKRLDEVATYVSQSKLVPIRGTNPLELSVCGSCGRKLFVPFPRSEKLYVVSLRGLHKDVYESSEGLLVLSEDALSRVSPVQVKHLKCTPISIRSSGLDGVSDPDLEF